MDRHAARLAGRPPLALAAILVAAWAAPVTVAATGPLTRWLPDRPGMATATAAISGFAAMAADTAIFALLVSKMATAPAGLAPSVSPRLRSPAWPGSSSPGAPRSAA